MSDSEVETCPTNNYNTMIIIFLIITIIVILGIIYFNYTECNKIKEKCKNNNTIQLTYTSGEEPTYSSGEEPR